MIKPQTYTVRNAKGQFLGRYRATSAKAAIQMLRDEQMTQASVFRGQIAKGLDDLIARVESTT